MYMEISQGNSLFSYLYLKQAEMICFSFYLFCKIREQEGRTGPACGEWSWHQWEGEGGRKGVRG
jgi:hypothetical protein